MRFVILLLIVYISSTVKHEIVFIVIHWPKRQNTLPQRR